jgi:hypothetical protein
MVLDPLAESDGVDDRRFSVLRRLIFLGFRRLRPDLRMASGVVPVSARTGDARFANPS